MAPAQKIQVLVGDETQYELPAANDSDRESFVDIDLNRAQPEPALEQTLIEAKDSFGSPIYHATNEAEVVDAGMMTEVKHGSIPSSLDFTNDKDKGENREQKVEMEERASQKKDPMIILDLSLGAPMINLNDKPSSESSSPSSRVSCITTDRCSVLAPSEPPRRPPSIITIDLTDDDDKPRAYPLLLMGCRRCLIYSMVPENDPHCPLCKRNGSIDEFRGSLKKKIKRG